MPIARVITLFFPILTAGILILFFAYYYRAMQPRLGTLEWIHNYDKKPLRFPLRRYPMERKDTLPILLITAIYAVVAFFFLGDTTAPQTFYHFQGEESVVITLDKPQAIGNVMYYTGLYGGHETGYTLSFSEDGKAWYTQQEMGHDYANLFKWLYATLAEDNPTAVRYIRITSDRTLDLGELAIYDMDGNLITDLSYDESLAPLFDEQDLIPDAPTSLNSAYFDEIYHARTAYEHQQNIYPYEVSHPPLGKLIIMLGIQIFGMVPFGWRFMGTLFGVLMLPILYIFLKNLFGKRVIASCGTLLFAFDFMHYTQTRIATIDTYSVFFILLMYFFMYRYITTPLDAPFRKTAPSLFLCGLFFGLGAAAKWTSIYAGLGLVALYVLYLVFRGRYYARENRMGEFGGFLVKTLLFSVLSFIIIPVILYVLSYIPYGLARGMTIADGMLWDPEYYKIIWDNQVFMFTYHSGLEATHAYSSRWYQWLLDIRPILYYRAYPAEGIKSAIVAFNNPVVSWGGLLAIISLFVSVIKRRSGKALFILIGYFSQLGPWLIISRCTFSYHYFPSTLFLVLAISYVLNNLWERKFGRYKLAVYGFTGGALLLFVAFYPVLSGLPAPQSYTQFLRWLPLSWPI